MIYSRNTYETVNLKHDDFLHGFGLDTSLLIQIRKLKGIEKSTEHDYYHEDGMSIDGTVRVYKYHPLQNKVLYDTEDNRELIIESIHKHWYNGYYWVLVYRMSGTKSHGTLFFKNVNCVDKTILEGIEETHKNYVFLDGTKW